MKLITDPMPTLRQAATRQVNEAYARTAALDLHRAQAHARKREIAAAVAAGGAAPAEFAEEAALRGVSAADLAATILAKPFAGDALELRRQRLLLAIEAAATPGALKAVLAAEGM